MPRRWGSSKRAAHRRTRRPPIHAAAAGVRRRVKGQVVDPAVENEFAAARSIGGSIDGRRGVEHVRAGELQRRRAGAAATDGEKDDDDRGRKARPRPPHDPDALFDARMSCVMEGGFGSNVRGWSDD